MTSSFSAPLFPQLARTLSILAVLGLPLACTPPSEVEFIEQDNQQTFAAPDCSALVGRVEADDATKSEGVTEIAFENVPNSAQISLTAYGREDAVVGTGLVTYEVPLTLRDAIVTRTTFTDDNGEATEVTESRVFGSFAQHTTTNRIGELESVIWWTQGADGNVVDASTGIKTDLPADGETVFALPGGNFAVLQYFEDGQIIKSEDELDAFVNTHGIDALEDSQTFRRLHAVFGDTGWQGAMLNAAALCGGYIEGAFAGPVNCEKSDPFGLIPTIHCALGAVGGGIAISTALIAAGVITTGTGGFIAAIVIAVVIYNVGNRITDLVKANSGLIAGGGGILLETAGLAPKDSYKDAAEFFKSSGNSTGDPHLTSLDGAAFDLQSAGEVILSRSTAGDFEIQSRQTPVGDGRCGSISVNSAAAVRMGETVVEYRSGSTAQILLDGEPFMPLTSPIEIAPGVFAVQSTRGGVVLSAASGEVVYLAGGTATQVYVRLPEDRQGAYEGLLGNGNGSTEDDFVTATGTLAVPPRFEDIHGAFVDNWRVTAETSLFTYENGEGPETFFIANFPEGPASLDDLTEEERSEAEAVCANITNAIAFRDCVFDVACTQDPGFADDHEIRSPETDAGVVVPLTFNGWTQQGDPAAGNWAVSDDERTVLQSLNGNPTFFVSPSDFFDTRLAGTLRTGNNGDDDQIGFVFGYQSPVAQDGDGVTQLKSYVVTWKAADQGAPEGIRLLYVDGDYDTQIDPVFWDVTSPDVTLIAEDIGDGTGWETKDHRFSLLYTANSIEIWMDGIKRISVAAEDLSTPLEPGRFGFFNYSQPGTEYREFSAGPPTAAPAREDCTLRIDTGDARRIREDETWGATCRNYAVTLDVEVSASATLTILEGTRVSTDNGAGIIVSDQAALIAVGTADNPILFDGDGETDSWAGISFLSDQPENRIEYAIIRDAGANTSAVLPDHGVIIQDGGSATIRNSHFEDIDGHGVRVEQGGSLTALTDSEFVRTSLSPISIPFGEIGQLSDSNTLLAAGENATVDILLNGTSPNGSLATSASILDLGIPYYLLGAEQALITGVDTVVDIAAGTTFIVDAGTRVEVSDGAALIGNGLSSERIVFRGLEEGAGSFVGLVFESASLSQLSHVDVEGGGSPFALLSAGIIVSGDARTPGNLQLDNCAIRASAGDGIFVAAGGSFEETGTVFADIAGQNIVEE